MDDFLDQEEDFESDDLSRSGTGKAVAAEPVDGTGAPAALGPPVEDDATPDREGDILRQYFAGRRGQATAALDRAEETASNKRFSARVGDALDSTAAAMAGVQRDPAYYQELLKASDRPIDQLSRREKLAKTGDTMVSSYLSQKYKLGQQRAAQKERLDAEGRRADDQRKFQADEKQKDRDLQLRLKQMEIAAAKAKERGQQPKLREEDEALIKTLATKNANKISVANQLSEAMKDWNTLSDDQKTVRGYALLKVLNSAEGADAVGADEAERTGSFLKLGNWTGAGPKRLMGRDFDGFKEQVLGQIKSLRRATDANSAQIERTRSAYGAPELAPARTPQKASPRRSAQENYIPGDVVVVAGKRYRVAEDGDTLTPL